MDLSLLAAFWAVHALLYLVTLVYHSATGQCLDKVAGERSPDEKIPFYHVRRRDHHFYFPGFIFLLSLIWTSVAAYCFGSPPGGYTKQALDAFTQPDHESTDSLSLLLGQLALLAYLCRRLYEMSSISIYSRRQSLSILGWLWSFAITFFTVLTLGTGGPSLTKGEACFSIWDLNWYHLVGAGIYIFASKIQNDAFVKLARLRKNRAGHVVTSGYKAPHGGMFDLVSCPHYFADILIYVSIAFYLGLGHMTWWLCTAYVIMHRMVLAHSTRNFYQSKFDDYPRDRKMIVPYLL